MQETDTTTHYICTGTCNGMSPEQGSCQAPGCPKNGQPLEPCSCTDGAHGASAESAVLEAPAGQ